MESQIVISLNDYPEEVCAPGTTLEQASARCKELKEHYIKHNSHVNPLIVHFHYRSVDVYEPCVDLKPRYT